MPTFSWMFVIIILSSTEGMYKNKQVHFYLFEFNLYSYLSKTKRIRESITVQFLFSEGIFFNISREWYERCNCNTKQL